MRAGRLRPILRLREEKRVPDGFGEFKTTLEFSRVLYAERTRFTGSQKIENAELFTDYRAEYKLRLHPLLAEKQRVKDVTTGIIYEIVAVFPEPDIDMQRISCERVNV